MLFEILLSFPQFEVEFEVVDDVFWKREGTNSSSIPEAPIRNQVESLRLNSSIVMYVFFELILS